MSLAATMTNKKTVRKTASHFSRPDLKKQVVGKILFRSRNFTPDSEELCCCWFVAQSWSKDQWPGKGKDRWGEETEGEKLPLIKEMPARRPRWRHESPLNGKDKYASTLKNCLLRESPDHAHHHRPCHERCSRALPYLSKAAAGHKA